MAQPESTVLITGGAGFIGSHLVRQWLAEQDDQVVTLDALTYAGLRESLGAALDDPRHELVVGDVADAATVAEVLKRRRPRVIVHLAAESHVDRSIVEPLGFVQTNVVGTATLLEAATRYWRELPDEQRQAFRFVHVSTDEVFGTIGGAAAFTDASPLQPNSPYSASKAAGEMLARSFAQTYGLPVVILNPGNHYGLRQLPEKLIPKMILLADRGEPLPVYGDGLHQRDWIHVSDGCRAIRAAAAAGVPGGRYLIGSGRSCTNREIVTAICDEVDQLRGDGLCRRDLMQSAADRPGHDRRYAIDASATRRKLGWNPQVELAEGLAATVAWYLNNEAWVSAAQASLGARDRSESSGPLQGGR